MAKHDELMDRIVETLKQPVRLSADLDRRIMAAVERPGWMPRALAWLRRPRTVTLTPLRGLGFAAAVALLLLLQWQWLAPGEAPGPAPAGAGGEVVQFVLVAPGASQVALVGDFNDWSTSATPMETVPENGLWTVTVPLEPGRYRYAFVVDGTTWVRDPAAPPALEDDFGRPNSVVMVRGS